MRVIILLLLLDSFAWPMLQTDYSKSANVVAPLKAMAAAAYLKKNNGHNWAGTVSKLPVDLQNLVDHCAKWDSMRPQFFHVIPLSVKYATMSPDTSTIAGVSQDPDGISKLRFITIGQERRNSLLHKFPGEMFPTPADENRLVNLAFHPTKQKIALAGITPNVALIGAREDDLLDLSGSYTSALVDRLDILQWNPMGDRLLAAGNNIIFIIPEDPNKKVTDVHYADSSIITTATWSESGKKILVKTGMYEVGVINWENRCKESGFSVNAQNMPPIIAVEWDDEEADTILVASWYTIQRIGVQRETFARKEYCDFTSCIEQILRLNNRYLLVKTRTISEKNIVSEYPDLKILDRIQKKIFPLHHVVCNGTLKLSTDKRFVYGSQVGDSIVDLLYLYTNR